MKDINTISEDEFSKYVKEEALKIHEKDMKNPSYRLSHTGNLYNKKIKLYYQKNLTVLSEDFYEIIEKFEWDINEKEEFVKEMLAFPPNKRRLILMRMVDKCDNTKGKS